VTLASRLKELCKKKGITATDLALFTGKSLDTARSWLSGKRTPRHEDLAAIAGLLGVPVDYLVEAEDSTDALGKLEATRDDLYAKIEQAKQAGDREQELALLKEVMSVTARIDKIKRALDTNTARAKALPVLGKIAAGPLRYTEQEVLRWEAVPATLPGDYIVEVEGDSLTGVGIEPGDMVVIQQVFNSAEPGQLCAVFVGDEATLKYMVPKDPDNPDGPWLLRAANPKYPDVEVTHETARVVGVVTRIIKRTPPCPPPPGGQG